MMDWEKVSISEGLEICSLAAEFKVYGYRGLAPFSVKVWEMDRNDNPYRGECEFSFWGPLQYSPYSSSRLSPSIEIAFRTAMQGITNFDKEEYPNEVVFFIKTEDDESIFFDGNGIRVPYEEVLKRRDEYAKNRAEKASKCVNYS